jgi:hypothetical protein
MRQITLLAQLSRAIKIRMNRGCKAANRTVQITFLPTALQYNRVK